MWHNAMCIIRTEEEEEENTGWRWRTQEVQDFDLVIVRFHRPELVLRADYMQDEMTVDLLAKYAR